MIKAEIKKEIMITNKEIAQFLWTDGSLLDRVEEILEDMLYDMYKMDYTARCNAVAVLTKADYIQIFKAFTNTLAEEFPEED